MQAAAAKMGDPLRGMVSIASKKLQGYLENHHHLKTDEEADNELVPEQESDWARWQKVFAEVETNESLSTMLTVSGLTNQSRLLLANYMHEVIIYFWYDWNNNPDSNVDFHGCLISFK